MFNRTGGSESFKRMVIESSYAKGFIQETAHELGGVAGVIDSSRISPEYLGRLANQSFRVGQTDG